MTPDDPPRDRAIADIDAIAHWLDSRFRVPGTDLRFGLDSLLGLIPGIGDAATLAPALYILFRAKRLGAPPALLLRMAANILVDAAIGAIPVLGDVFDLLFKANTRNLELLRRHFDQRADRNMRP